MSIVRVFFGVSVLGLAMGTSGVRGQTPQAQPAPAASSPGQAPAADPGVVELAQDPLDLPTIGVRVFAPVGSEAHTETVGAEAKGTIIAKDQSWAINIAGPRTSNPDTTITAATDAALKQLAESAGVAEVDRSRNASMVGTTIKLLSREPAPGGPKLFIKNGVREYEFERFYASMPSVFGKAATVRGFAITKVAPTQFITFELITTEPLLPVARRIFETVIAAAEIDDPTRANAERATAVKAGEKVTELLNAQMWHELIATGAEHWERLYIPASSGADADAKEIAYRRIRLGVGTGNTTDPKVGDPGPGEGYVVRLDARYLDRARCVNGELAEGRMIDSRSVFFTAPDRSNEVWSVEMTMRDPKSKGVFKEVAGRTDKSMSVQIDGTGIASRIVKPTVPPEGYVSRAEAVVLQDVIARSKIFTDLGFYVYSGETESIRLRRDSLQRPADDLGAMILATRPSEDKKPQMVYYNAKGEWIKTVMPDGSIWERVTPEKLMQLWRSKGLPVN